MALSITQATNPTGCNHYIVTCLDGLDTFTVPWHDTNPSALTTEEREQFIQLLLRYKRSGGSTLQALIGVAI